MDAFALHLVSYKGKSVNLVFPGPFVRKPAAVLALDWIWYHPSLRPADFVDMDAGSIDDVFRFDGACPFVGFDGIFTVMP